MIIIPTEAPFVAQLYILINKCIAFYGTQIYLHYSQEPAAVLSQMTPAHVIPSCFQLHFNIILQFMPKHSQ